MNTKKMDTILHPIRMRILQTLIGGRHLTIQQIGERLTDVPQATLYRHLNKLLAAEILAIAEEKKVRGTIEKVLKINEKANLLTEKEVSEFSREDHFNYFFTFLTNLLGDFESYLSQDNFDLKADGVSYRQANLYLNDEEFIELLQTIGHAISTATKNEPTKDRKLRTIATIILPQKNSNNH